MSAVLVEVTPRGALYRSVYNRKTKDELQNLHKPFFVDDICESTQVAAILWSILSRKKCYLAYLHGQLSAEVE